MTGCFQMRTRSIRLEHGTSRGAPRSTRTREVYQLFLNSLSASGMKLRRKHGLMIKPMCLPFPPQVCSTRSTSRMFYSLYPLYSWCSLFPVDLVLPTINKRLSLHLDCAPPPMSNCSSRPLFMTYNHLKLHCLQHCGHHYYYLERPCCCAHWTSH